MIFSRNSVNFQKNVFEIFVDTILQLGPGLANWQLSEPIQHPEAEFPDSYTFPQVGAGVGGLKSWR